MSIDFTMRQLLDAGVHFGHVTRRWNPEMKPYIYGVRNKIHIIDLDQTVEFLEQALQAIYNLAAEGGRFLFVGTKRQAQDPVREAAKAAGQHFVAHRWLGGTLTNWKTITNSIHKLKQMDAQLEEENTGLTKKELLKLTNQRDKLERVLGGIRNMADMPGMMFVVDVNREATAIAEAKRLGIPVVGIVDTNARVDDVAYPIPGNDDALRAIQLYCDLVTEAILKGIASSVQRKGIDPGAAENPPEEKIKAREIETEPDLSPVIEIKPEDDVSQKIQEADKTQKETEKTEAKPAEKPVTKKLEEKVAPKEKETKAENPEAKPAEKTEKPPKEAPKEVKSEKDE